MAWTIIGTGIEGDLHGKSFGLTLFEDTKTWQVGGPDVDMFFNIKNGTFIIAGIPENGTQLVSPTGAEVAFLKALNGTTPIGGTGTGRASEKGANFNWRLDSK
jgi:hypothetical protein